MKTIRCLASFAVLLTVVRLLPAQGIEFISSIDTPGDARSVFIEGAMAYVADGPAGLQIIDISNRAAPVLNGSFAVPNFAGDVAVKGTTIYLATSFDGMHQINGGTYVIDGQNPKLPIEIRFISSGSSLGTYGIAIREKQLFTWGTGLSLFDIADSLNPILQDEFDTVIARGKMAVLDNFIAGVKDQTISIIEVIRSRQLKMFAVHRTPIWTDTSDVAFLGKNIVYSMLINSSSQIPGIQVLALNKQSIIPRAAYYTHDHVWGLDAQDPFIVAANGADGVFVLEAISLDELVLRARFNTKGTAHDVVFRPPYIYVADGEAGLTILKYNGPAPAIPPNVAVLIGHSIPQRMLPGESVTASVTYANLGSVNWTAPNYKLALRNENAPLWQEITPRVNVPAGTLVRPDAEHTFTFTLKAPGTEGTHTLEFSMVEEFVQFFGTPLKVSVAVGTAAATQWELYQ